MFYSIAWETDNYDKSLTIVAFKNRYDQHNYECPINIKQITAKEAYQHSKDAVPLRVAARTKDDVLQLTKPNIDAEQQSKIIGQAKKIELLTDAIKSLLSRAYEISGDAASLDQSVVKAVQAILLCKEPQS